MRIIRKNFVNEVKSEQSLEEWNADEGSMINKSECHTGGMNKR